MSTQVCEATALKGFPVYPSQRFSTADNNLQSNLNQLIAPTDFTINWGTATNMNISVITDTTNTNNNIFHIRGFYSDQITLKYREASYTCSDTISIVKNQHQNLSDIDAPYEMILAFYINSSQISSYPTLPHIILMCRPLVTSDIETTTPFWKYVNSLAKSDSSTAHAAFVDMSSFYGYDTKTLMPMLTYQSCLPIKQINSSTDKNIGSLRIRVHVVNQPIDIGSADSSGTNKCNLIPKYDMGYIVSKVFDDMPATTKFQFQSGESTNDGFPSGTSNYLVPFPFIIPTVEMQSIFQKYIYLVPEAFLGKSIAEIAAMKTYVTKPPKKKAFKCYRIDPAKDIVDDQILIDPTTGETLTDTMKQKAYEETGGDPAYLNINGPDTSGIMPGDIQHVSYIIMLVFGTLMLLSYLLFIFYKIFFIPQEQREPQFFTYLIGHIIVFVVLLTVLALIGVYADDNHSANNSLPTNTPLPAGADSRCYIDGKKLGTSIYSNNLKGNIMIYTQEECNQLHGVNKWGECMIPDTHGFSGSYTVFCSDDPKIVSRSKS